MTKDFDTMMVGWNAAVKMALKEPIRYSKFNKEDWDIHNKKAREMPANLKELDKLLWKAFRAGQAHVGESVSMTIRNQSEWTSYFDNNETGGDDESSL